MVGQKVAAFLPPGISYFSSHKHTILYGQIWQAARIVNSTTQKKTKELLVIFSLPTSAEVVSIERLLGEKEGIWYSRSVFFSSDVLALLDYNSATKI